MKQLLDFILIAGILTAILILLLAPKREHRALPRKVLLTLFTIFLFVTLNLYGALNEILWLEILGFLLENGARLSVGPLLLLYVNSIFRSPQGLVKSLAWHFIPFVMHTILITLPFLVSVLLERAVFAYLPIILEMEFIAILQGIYLLLYCALALIAMKKYSAKAQQISANPVEGEQNFVRNLVIGTILVVILDLTGDFYRPVFPNLDWDSGFLTVAGLVVLMIYLAYYGVRQSRVLIPDFILAPSTSIPSTTEPALAAGSPMFSEETLEEMSLQLEVAMVERKAFLDDELTLSKLAGLTETTDKKLSHYLNSELGNSFYEYVNGFRIESVKEALVSGKSDHLTIFAIAMDCGFRSKTTFNRLFKKSTGVSPSIFRNQHRT